MFDDFEEARILGKNDVESERSRKNMLSLKEFENLHAFKFKLGNLTGFDPKRGTKISVRLALLKGN